MKGKRDFTRNEIEEIVALIRQRCSAAPDKQKRIRDKMRSIGFYGKDDFGVYDMTEEKFYNLIDKGKITIKDSNTAKVPPVSSNRETNATTNNNLKDGLEAWCGDTLDIYDDRLTVTSSGGMYNGMLIQDLDIKDVSSERRNPILANVMAQLDHMEKRGSGLTRICNETKALEGYKDELKPKFKSTPTQFQTIIFASSNTSNVGDHDGDMSKTKLTERQQKIINLIKESPTITGKQMSEILSVSQRTIERDLSALQKSGILKREGNDNGGVWVVVV